MFNIDVTVQFGMRDDAGEWTADNYTVRGTYVLPEGHDNRMALANEAIRASSDLVRRALHSHPAILQAAIACYWQLVDQRDPVTNQYPDLVVWKGTCGVSTMTHTTSPMDIRRDNRFCRKCGKEVRVQPQRP